MENAYRDVNIALANEFALGLRVARCSRRGSFTCIGIHPVNILQPGIGVGGHCIPVHPWFLKEVALTPLAADQHISYDQR